MPPRPQLIEKRIERRFEVPRTQPRYLTGDPQVIALRRYVMERIRDLEAITL